MDGRASPSRVQVLSLCLWDAGRGAGAEWNRYRRVQVQKGAGGKGCRCRVQLDRRATRAKDMNNSLLCCHVRSTYGVLACVWPLYSRGCKFAGDHRYRTCVRSSRPKDMPIIILEPNYPTNIFPADCLPWHIPLSYILNQPCPSAIAQG